MPKTEVEKWKVAPDMNAFLRAWRKTQRVQAQLGTMLERKLQEAKALRDATVEAQLAERVLLQQAPEQALRGIEGQEDQQTGEDGTEKFMLRY